jgi:hypothetical protein
MRLAEVCNQIIETRKDVAKIQSVINTLESLLANPELYKSSGEHKRKLADAHRLLQTVQVELRTLEHAKTKLIQH